MPFEYRSEALNRNLAALHREAPDVRGSAVMTGDGLVIAAYPPGWDGDRHNPTGGENVAAMAAVLAGQAERTGERLAQGRLERLVLEGEHGTLAILPITDDAGLALLIAKDAKLGLTLQAARRIVGQLANVLRQSE